VQPSDVVLGPPTGRAPGGNPNAALQGTYAGRSGSTEAADSLPRLRRPGGSRSVTSSSHCCSEFQHPQGVSRPVAGVTFPATAAGWRYRQEVTAACLLTNRNQLTRLRPRGGFLFLLPGPQLPQKAPGRRLRFGSACPASLPLRVLTLMRPADRPPEIVSGDDAGGQSRPLATAQELHDRPKVLPWSDAGACCSVIG
jgi:hypothetical protein